MKTNNPERKRGTVLITGGSGLIGQYLTSLLLANGYNVSHLSRIKELQRGVKVYFWDPEKQIIDAESLVGVDSIIHLAGANIGEKRWTKARKQEIIDSRVKTTQLLYKTVTDNGIQPESFISASAIGYYGTSPSDLLFDESDSPATGFLGRTCSLWEQSAGMFAGLGMRTVKIRTGIVLDSHEGVLPALYKPAKYGLVLRLGSGKQYMPWIHIRDLGNIYLKALTDTKMKGAYNAVSPQHTNMEEFIRTMARVIHKPVLLPAVPEWVLKAVLGEMSELVTRGNRVSSEKICSAGFQFLYPDLGKALANLINNY